MIRPTWFICKQLAFEDAEELGESRQVLLYFPPLAWCRVRVIADYRGNYGF